MYTHLYVHTYVLTSYYLMTLPFSVVVIQKEIKQLF